MISVGRIVCDLLRNGVGQFSLKDLFPSKDIRDAVSALHATLPCVHHSPDVRAALHKAHVNNIRDVQHHDDILKIITYILKHLKLYRSQIIAAFRRNIVLVLARCPSDHHYRLVGNSSSLRRKRLRHRHILLAPRFTRPAASAVVKRILCNPLLIAVRQFFVDLDIVVTKPVQQICRVWHIHCAAGTCPAPVILLLASSKHRYIVLHGQRKNCVFIFQKNGSLSGYPSAQY